MKNSYVPKRTVKEKRILIHAIRTWRWKMVGHAQTYPEELLNTIIEGMLEGTRIQGVLEILI